MEEFTPETNLLVPYIEIFYTNKTMKPEYDLSKMKSRPNPFAYRFKTDGDLIFYFKKNLTHQEIFTDKIKESPFKKYNNDSCT